MKKIVVILLLLSCNQKSNEEKYHELFQLETNLGASYHDLSKMILKLDSVRQPAAFQAAKDELTNLEKRLDSIRSAMMELPDRDSLELHKYSR